METHHCVKMGWPDSDRPFVIPKEEDLYHYPDFLAFPPAPFPLGSTWDQDLLPELGYFSPVSCLNMFLAEPIFTAPIPPEAIFFDCGGDDFRFGVKNEIIDSFGVQNQERSEYGETGDGGSNQPATTADDPRDSKKSPKIEVVSNPRNSLSRKKISEYFTMPIKQAAEELNIGLTLLKKRCREVGIRRWPHRKFKSLQTLINNVQEMGEGDRKRTEAIAILEREKKLMEELPDMELEVQTKRLRQAYFKANYKKRRITNKSSTRVNVTILSDQCGSSNSPDIPASCVETNNAVCGLLSSSDVKIKKDAHHDEYDQAEEEFNSVLFEYLSSDCIYSV